MHFKCAGTGIHRYPYYGEVSGTAYTPSVSAIIDATTDNSSGAHNLDGVLKPRDFDIANSSGPDLGADLGVVAQCGETFSNDGGGGEYRGYDTKTLGSNEGKVGKYAGLRHNGGYGGDRGNTAIWRRYTVNFTEAGDWYATLRQGNNDGRLSGARYDIAILSKADLSNVIDIVSVDMTDLTFNDLVAVGMGSNIPDHNVALIGGALGLVDAGSASSWFKLTEALTIPEAGEYVVEFRIAEEVGSNNSFFGNLAFDMEEFVEDKEAPEIQIVSALFEGSNLSVSTNENGTVYVVPKGTNPTKGDIEGAALASGDVTVEGPNTIIVSGLAQGSYSVFAIDAAGNVSSAYSLRILPPDESGPVILFGSGNFFEVGGDINLRLDEPGTVHVVPESTAGDIATIEGASLVSAEVENFDEVVVFSLPESVVVGTYWTYAIDSLDNVSDPVPFNVVEEGLKFRTVTFDEDIFINQLEAPSVLGEPVVDNGRGNGGDNSLNYEMLKGIHPGSGQWFASPGSFGKVEDGGNPGSYVGRIEDNNFGRGIMYMYNNEDHAINSSVEMSFDYIFEVAQDDRFAVTVYGAKKNGDGYVTGVIRTNQGQGAAGDNQAAQWKGDGEEGSNSGDATELYQEWGFDGPTGGWTNHTFTADFSTDQYDFIFVCFGVAFAENPADPTAAFGLDNVTLPFQAGVIDDMKPFLRKDLVLMGNTDPVDSVAVFSSEAGMIYLVPSGTAADKASILADSVASAEAIVSSGSILAYDGVPDGRYEVYLIDRAGNVSIGKHLSVGTDVFGPVIMDVSPFTINPRGTEIEVTADEISTVYLVPDGTLQNETEIMNASVSSVALEEKVAGTMGTDVEPGEYVLYAVDTLGNVSSGTDYTVQILDEIAPIISGVVADVVEPGDDLTFTLDEASSVYLVPSGTTADTASIYAASLVSGDFIDVASAVTITVPESSSLGDYQLYAVDLVFNISAPTAITLADLSGPVLIEESPDMVEKGDNIRAVLDEDGTIYAVPTGTDPGNVESANVGMSSASGGLPAFINTGASGFAVGSTYEIYAKDDLDNWSGVLFDVTITATVLTADDQQTLLIYPNPTANKLYFRDLEGLKINQMMIYNMSGMLMLEKRIQYTEYELDMSHLNTGLYMLHLETESGIRIFKITKAD